MTRINTNVSSLIAQNSLSRSNNALQISLTRLSTGLRINSGRDDPAGLIASEAIRSDIVSLEKAISNSERVNQVISTADSALGQASKLLNDIRGLVTESANVGAISEDQIAANQLQIDSSLEALNLIANTTSFQGRRLIDGSLDFTTTTTAGSGFDTIVDLNIDQANLGTAGSVAVDVQISAAATQAQITNTLGFSPDAAANTTLTFAAEADFAAGTFASDAAAALFFQGTTPGTSLVGVTIQFVGQALLGAGNETAAYDSTANTLTITIDSAAVTTSTFIATAVNNQVAEFQVVPTAGAGTIAAADLLAVSRLTAADAVTVTAAPAFLGPNLNNTQVDIVGSAAQAAGTAVAAYNASAGTLTITVHNTFNTTLAVIAAAITLVPEFTGAAVVGGDGNINVGQGNLADFDASASTGNTGGGVLNDDIVLELSGADGLQILNLGIGTSRNQFRDAVNLLSDATGVISTITGSTLNLTSSAYGTDAFVDVNVITEGALGTFVTGLGNVSRARDLGDDIVATVNGVGANGDGNTLSINTATLDLSLSVNAGSSTNIAFTITGGGGLFQLGPDVVSNQQARIGITSVSSARLGGVDGLLYQVGSGENAAMDTDTGLAARIVDQAINKVTTLRGRLGAFQRTTVDTNIAALNDTLNNITAAESQIRDADFAKETASLTRAQILVQAGTSVLAIANSNPQNVLALLR